jgi:DNA polymerase zeta
LCYENPRKLNAERFPFGDEVTTKMQGGGGIVKEKACAGFSEDISQISGPDGKSRPTPLSQSGFQDPASVGGGQQLTLLSIEVLVISDFFLFSFCKKKKFDIFAKLNVHF